MHKCWHRNEEVIRLSGKLHKQEHRLLLASHARKLCDQSWLPRPQIRSLSSATTSDVLERQKAIPLANRELHNALKDVQQKASSHVNISRLQLALASLETTKPTTRLAILGLNSDELSRKIARLLLADPLEEEQPWEQQILEQQATNGFIVRYGQPQNPNVPLRSTLPVLTIPSPVLQTLNIELLVGSINSQSNDTLSDVPAEAFLAPAVGVPTSFDGRQVTVNQPVHAALLVSDGIDSLTPAFQLLSQTAFTSTEERDLVTLCIELTGQKATQNKNIHICDFERAAHGLDAIRSSISNATTYSQAWTLSGLPSLSQWLRDSTNTLQNTIKLINSLLKSAQSSLDESQAAAHQRLAAKNMDHDTRSRMNSAIDAFSRSAHQELQAGLTSAWASPSWSKLSWYKLFWRIDDVGLIVSDLVTNTWLPKTEKAVYEISGRFLQLGINPVSTRQDSTAIVDEGEKSASLVADASVTQSNIEPERRTTPLSDHEFEQKRAGIGAGQINHQAPLENQNLVYDPPTDIVSSISMVRKEQLTQQVQNLTSTAQQLLFRTLSISGLSGGLSTLLYTSAIAPSIFEAGSVFALGTVVALWRLQSGWQSATRTLEKGLSEAGRNVINDVVEQMRALMQMGSDAIARDVRSVSQLDMKARQAVARAAQEAAALSRNAKS